MKKLMIAAAAAAMIGGAYAKATEEWLVPQVQDAITNKTALFTPYELDRAEITNYNGVASWTNTIKINRFDMNELQVLTYKQKATSSKFFCLNDGKNDIDEFYKPSAVSTEKTLALDGVIYYNGKAWVNLVWNKDRQDVAFFGNAGGQNWNYPDLVTPKMEEKDYITAITNFYVWCDAQDYKGKAPVWFDCFDDKGGKKVWAGMRAIGVLGGVRYPTTEYMARSGDSVTSDTNARADVYAAVDADKDPVAKNVKSTDNGWTVSLKTYKDDKALGKAIDAILKKFVKAGGKLPDYMEMK